MRPLTFRMLRGLCLILIFLTYAGAASAEKVRTLTDENIRAFITKTTQIIKGHAKDMPDDAMMQYLDQHLHPESRFKTVMHYNVPGYPPNEVTVSFNKSEFLEGIKRSETSVSDYDNQIQILSIKISSNQKVATVKSKNKESGVMQVIGDTENPDEKVPISGESTCTQILAINKGFIQMYHASCVTNIEFQQNY